MFGFGACIACVLAIQVAAVVVWLRSVPDDQRLREYTHVVADDLAGALTADPGLDVQRYLNEHYSRPLVSFTVNLAGGSRDAFVGPNRPPDNDTQAFREWWARPQTRLTDSWVQGPYKGAPIVVNGQLTGGVGVVVARTWRELLGARMLMLSVALLLAGTGLVGWLIVGNLRRRLSDLEDTARRYGGGDFTARANEQGDDELATLAAAFNRMAFDLGTRDDLLKVADRRRRMLLADVSHELMTPLTAMRAYREVLAMSEVARDPEASHCLSVIGDETERLERLVGDLLDLARLEAGGDSLSPGDVAVENLFGRVAARHEPNAKVKGVQLTTSVEAGAEILYGDPLRLEQALQNLAANALRHTPPGGEVELRAELHGEHVFLSVRDNGLGIPHEHLPFVFDRFYKVDQARTGGAAAGSGLGLSVVKAIVERHGGSITVSSTPGVATVFTIRMPIGMETAPTPARVSSATAA
ncbi:MAG TPA: HAMP domain-containing sensor histidine kinase [Vicinamibacterales bacterium]|nr:HAMP domain-containing sensor histidine kinase [Vicinamibacterales bacterium]